MRVLSLYTRWGRHLCCFPAWARLTMQIEYPLLVCVTVLWNHHVERPWLASAAFLYTLYSTHFSRSSDLECVQLRHLFGGLSCVPRSTIALLLQGLLKLYSVIQLKISYRDCNVLDGSSLLITRTMSRIQILWVLYYSGLVWPARGSRFASSRVFNVIK